MRILYVEDNPANLSLMQRIARMGGHEIISYTEGEAALNNFDHDAPDLVLLDVQLAGALTGLDVVKTLRERGVKKPVIAVTAYAMVGDRERCLEAGFDTYISKPLPVAELVELVQKYELDAKIAAGAPAAAAPARPTAVDTMTVPPVKVESAASADVPKADDMAETKTEPAVSLPSAQSPTTLTDDTLVDRTGKVARDIAAQHKASSEKK